MTNERKDAERRSHGRGAACRICEYHGDDERAHVEAVAADWLRLIGGAFEDDIACLANLIAAERQAADAAATRREKAIADVRVDRASAAARDAALEEAAELCSAQTEMESDLWDGSAWALRIRALRSSSKEG